MKRLATVVWLCGTLIQTVVANGTLDNEKLELKLINVLFRHGDRTPIADDMFPNDPHRNETYYPEGFGQLTNNGKLRSFSFGRQLRERYDDFLGEFYTPESVLAQSTEFDRTKMTLQLVLASLYPPQRSQVWNDQLNWQPIPTQYFPRKRDWLMNPMIFCSDFLNESEKVDNLPEVVSEIEEYREFMNELTELTGRNITKPIDMYHIYHQLVTESSMSLTLPQWSEEMYPRGKLYDGTILAYRLLGYTKAQLRLNGGRLLYNIIQNMEFAKKCEEDTRKIYLYSGHENNLSALMQTLGVYKPHVPEYLSGVVIELYQLKSRYFVKVLHYLGIPPVFEELEIPGCDELCSFENFVDLLRDVIPSPNELHCGLV